NARELGLVFDEVAELEERPIVQSCPLAATGLNPASDALEVFKSDTDPGALRLGDDGLCDAVVRVPLKPGLAPLELPQLPPGRPGPLALEIAAPVSILAADLIHLGSRPGLSVGIEGQVDDPQVNTEHVLDRELIGSGH